MFILALLLAGIFAIVGSTTELASEIGQSHKRESEVHGFAQFCERTFRRLPGVAEVRLRVKESGRQYLSELALKNSLSPLGSSGAEGLTILRTEQTTDGYLRIVLESLSNEESAAHELGKGGVVKTRLMLLENVSQYEWKIFNPRSNQWEGVWNDKLSLSQQSDSNLSQQPQPGALRPELIELTLAIGSDTARRFVFWVPPAKVPVQIQPTSPDNSQPPQVTPPSGT